MTRRVIEYLPLEDLVSAFDGSNIEVWVDKDGKTYLYNTLSKTWTTDIKPFTCIEEPIVPDFQITQDNCTIYEDIIRTAAINYYCAIVLKRFIEENN